MDHTIFLIDMQTFYASVEKMDFPGFRSKPLIVAGDPKQRSGIVLAACPIAKQFGVLTAEPLGQALNKCPQAIVRLPRMQHYINMSAAVTRFLQHYTHLVEPYSIDEQFMDVTSSLNLFGDPLTLAQKIQQDMQRRFGIYVRIGIGPNKALAKMACDHFSKKNQTGISLLNKRNMEKKLWALPIGALFGVGQRMEQHFIGMGIRKIGHLARFPVDLLRKRWGVNGELLWQTAHGLDASPVSPNTFIDQKAIGHHLTLPYDYTDQQAIRVILLELSEEVAARARSERYMGSVVSIGVSGPFEQHNGFHRQITLPYATNFGLDIYHAVHRLFNESWNRQPIRAAAVTLSDLQKSTETFQLDLFARIEEKARLSAAVDRIHCKYGRTALFRGASLLPASQLRVRAGKIGGHFR
ncbi:DNA polymerase IV [Sporolactobacillus terrae]|uniref:DNA polymerase IV n=1 Tax=Sporolactobacillus terrae TaxID=269673 RepID=A0A410D7T3_9BACL|nr:DNA polymerase IV [Sporolactobacillus terrae]QAA22169.1 DNA polymerase IV [Sporolactobacillus terrae]QAA25142.1 DNA polymerase IV [Sporolactobacillus terrae]UAK16963.1 DNA polymerase IV [Sporolactobacillus terrae]BBN98475.1 DNA polymerase IV 2 [Sporolactobacillus terrae]